MDNGNKNENIDVCRECGGMCCIKCGCDYAVGDFEERTYKSFLDSLSVGDKSIVAMIDFRTLNNGKIIAEPTLYIRARNVNREIIDLVSMKTRCSLLLGDGCSYDYEHRPFGGRNLKPVRYNEGGCRPLVNPMVYLNEWKSYQKQLSKIVKYYTGKSVIEKISEDVEELFYRCLIKDYDGVSELELIDLNGFVLLLMRAYPEEYERALRKSRGNSFTRILNKNYVK